MGIVVREKHFPSATGICEIKFKIWQPEEPRICLQIIHGMAEHIARYDAFARFLAENGVLVYGMDLAGHGKSIREGEPYGFFGEKDGWDHLIADNITMHDMVLKDYPALPRVLFGHSMGSFLARTYAGRRGQDFNAFIFSGTAGSNPAISIAKAIAKSAIRKGNGKQENHTLNKLGFGSYNKQFKPQRTPFDWLSRDNASVDRYIEDPLCGFVFTSCGFYDLFSGLSEISARTWAERVPNKPILLFSGTQDPVGNNGKGVRQVYRRLKKNGHEPCLKLYEGGRHEMLNEINRDEVYRDVLLFLESVAASGELE